MALPNSEVAEINLIINSKQANKDLRTVLSNVQQIQAAIQQLSQTSGASFSQVGTYLKNLYATQSQNIAATKEQGAEMRKAFNAQVNTAVGNLDRNLKQATASGKGFANVLRIIRGTLVAMAVFRTIQFIDEALRKATETAKEFETSLFRIANVERILSQGGVETSLQGLRQVIIDVKKELPIFSEADITQQVSLIGIMTKEFRLTEEQIGDVAKAIGVLNIRSGEAEDLLTTTNKVLTALVAPSGRGRG